MPVPTLPLIVDIRDWPELQRRLCLRVVKRSWPAGQPRPVLEVEIISAEMEAKDGAEIHPLHGSDHLVAGWQSHEYQPP